MTPEGTVYKLTDLVMRTFSGYQWALNETRTFPGSGELCGSGWAHAYTHPLLAVLLNPIHANFPAFRLFRGQGIVGRSDGLKVGCSSLRLQEEILPIPALTREHRVRFALYCALKVYAKPAFVRWAEQWLSGEDRSVRAAKKASKEAAWVASDASWVASEAAEAAWAAAEAAWVATEAAWVPSWAAWAAQRAAGAARWSVEVAEEAGIPYNLIEIAEAACAEESR